MGRVENPFVRKDDAGNWFCTECNYFEAIEALGDLVTRKLGDEDYEYLALHRSVYDHDILLDC